MRLYSLVVEPKLIKEIDKFVKEHGMYSSRSDFIRDSIRARLIEIKKTIAWEETKIKSEGRKAQEIVEEVMQGKKFIGVH